ncbi:MAG: MaoC family dehydratase [Ignisphaera sp.]|jgi:3-hydroxybutyryl-CoA dehydratase|nr:MaoC family dehydratase [Ignisphaera sp.]
MSSKKVDLSELSKLYAELGGELKPFEKFSGKIDVGYKVVYEKRITEVDVAFFGLVSGDLNPLHFDEELASRTKFGGRVVHGALTTSLVSAALARLPGIPVALEVYFKYTSPVRIGDVVRVEGVVTEKERENRFKVSVKCLVGERVVAEGYAKVLIW